MYFSKYSDGVGSAGFETVEEVLKDEQKFIDDGFATDGNVFEVVSEEGESFGFYQVLGKVLTSKESK